MVAVQVLSALWQHGAAAIGHGSRYWEHHWMHELGMQSAGAWQWAVAVMQQLHCHVWEAQRLNESRAGDGQGHTLRESGGVKNGRGRHASTSQTRRCVTGASILRLPFAFPGSKLFITHECEHRGTVS